MNRGEPSPYSKPPRALGAVSCLLACCTAFVGARSSSAQQLAATTSSIADPIACSGEKVSSINIRTYPPFALGGPKVVAKAAKLLTSAHAVTKASVVRRYLALQVGDSCTELRRRESERILRAQPYLADASVLAFSDGMGGVVLDVSTVDEVSVVFSGRISGKSPVVQEIRMGETNLGGGGVHAIGSWRNSEFYRDVYRLKVTHYQFLGRPYQLSVDGHRNAVGGSWEIQASHPFITDLQRISWRMTTGATDNHVPFLRQGADEASLPFTRTYSDIGGLYAFGPPGKLLLLGASLSREREHTGREPVIVSDSGLLPDTSQVLVGRYGEHRTSRVNLLLGYRDIRLLRVTGFDALEGVQDVRLGFQLSALIGKGFNIAEGDEEDYFVSSGIYYGAGNSRSFAAIETMSERRRDVGGDQWDGVLASGRAAWYVKPVEAHTAIASVEYGGGWRQRVPFQMSFANRQGGLRGFSHSDLAGGQRIVFRFEDRMRIGHFRQFASLGGAAFVDAGKLWAGDAPFGVKTGVNASIGVSLLAALPPRSRRLWRVDLAMPLTDRHSSKFEVRFNAIDATRWFWREPSDVQAGRERSVPTSVYNWP